jgi:lysophospholipase L1-like esterase
VADFEVPAGYGIPLVELATDLLPEPTMDAISLAVVPAVVASPELADNFVPHPVNASTVGNLATLVRKLDREVSDAQVLVVSDSTANGTSEWAYLTAQFLAAQYPAYTVTASFWDETGDAGYSTALTIQTGTGSKVLTFYIAAKSGSGSSYFQGSRFTAAVRALSPDVVFINHGHNLGDPVSANNYQAIRNGYLALTESISRIHPNAGFVLIAQNPTTIPGRETWQAIKANALMEVAGIRGYGFIDVHEAFVAYGDWSTDLMVDTVHPNDAGSILWAGLVCDALTEARGSTPTRLEPSPLLISAKNYITNFDFSDWSGTDPAASWGAPVLATSSKDTTNYETGTQALKLTSAAGSGSAQITASITGGNARELRGEWITVAVRVRKPTANGATVRVQVQDSTGAGNARLADVSSESVDGYVWMLLNKRIDIASTAVYLTLMCRTTGTSIVDASFDRAYIVKGLLPFAG